MKKELCANTPLINQIFHSLLQNWEFPIKGFGNFVEGLFDNYLMCISDAQSSSSANTIYEDLLERIEAMDFKNTKRRFNSLKILLKYLHSDMVMLKAPNILKELIEYPNTICETGVVMLYSEILKKKLEELKLKYPKNGLKVAEEWVDFWFPTYIESFHNVSGHVAKVTVEYFHPHIFTQLDDCYPIVLSKMNQYENKTKNHLAALVGVYQKARLYGYLISNDNMTDYVVGKEVSKRQSKKIPKKKGKNTEEADPFAEYLNNDFSIVNFLEDMITNENRHIVLSAFRTIVEPRKDSYPIVDFEFRLVKKFLVYNMKNSYPDFRNDSSNCLRKFMHRCRNVFNTEVTQIDESPDNFRLICEQNSNFNSFSKFMSDLYHIFVVMIYPDGPYESSYPLLELLKTIYESFGIFDFIYRKKNLCKGTQFLRYCNFYSKEIFEQLLNNFRCSWDTSRTISFQILRYFPNDLEYLTEDYVENVIHKNSLALIKNPIIKDIEAGAYGLALLMERSTSVETKIQKLEDLVQELANKRKLVELNFLKNETMFCENLYHGLLSTLCTVLDNMDNILKMIEVNKPKLKAIFSLLFEELIAIIFFAKEIISYSNHTYIVEDDFKAYKDTNVTDEEQGESTAEKEKLEKTRAAMLSKLATGNTLMDSFNDANFDPEEMNTENLTVVSFYLISKESGLLFEKICSMIIWLQRTKQSAKKVKSPVEG